MVRGEEKLLGFLDRKATRTTVLKPSGETWKWTTFRFREYKNVKDRIMKVGIFKQPLCLNNREVVS